MRQTNSSIKYVYDFYRMSPVVRVHKQSNVKSIVYEMLCVAFAMFVVTPSQYPRLRWQPLLREESKGKDRTRKNDSLNYG